MIIYMKGVSLVGKLLSHKHAIVFQCFRYKQQRPKNQGIRQRRGSFLPCNMPEANNSKTRPSQTGAVAP